MIAPALAGEKPRRRLIAHQAVLQYLDHLDHPIDQGTDGRRWIVPGQSLFDDPRDAVTQGRLVREFGIRVHRWASIEFGESAVMIVAGRHLGKAASASYVLGMRTVLALLLAVLMAGSMTAWAGQDDPRLDTLFAHLQATKDLEQANQIQVAIWQIWIEGDNDEVNTVMTRGIDEMSLGDLPEALRNFSYVVDLAPDLAEGWNKHATVLYMMGDYEGSVRDIQKTLALEPRHWGALSGLGLINMRLERVEQAIEAFEEAIAINPHLQGTRERIKQLKEFSKGKPT